MYAAIATQHLATVAALLGDHSRAARLCGYVDAWYEAQGCERDATERRTYEILTDSLRNAMREPEIATLVADGAALSQEQATAEALAVYIR